MKKTGEGDVEGVPKTMNVFVGGGTLAHMYKVMDSLR